MTPPLKFTGILSKSTKSGFDPFFNFLMTYY